MARLLDEAEVGRGVLGSAPLGRVVRHLDRAAGRPAELERLGDGGEYGLALAAHVRRVDALVARHDVAECQQLLGTREAAGRIHEAGRHAVRAGAHACIQQPPQVRELRAGDGALGEPDDGEPQRAVPHERRDVDGMGRPAQRGEVLAEGAPIPGHRVETPGVVRPIVDGVGAVPLGERRRGHAAVADDVRGHALPDRRLGARVQQDGEIRVRVRVDEAGSHVPVAGVDRAPAAQRARRSDGGDAVAAHTDVTSVPRIAAAVDDASAGDDEVVDHHPSPISKISYSFSHGGPAHTWMRSSSRSQIMLPTVMPWSAGAASASG